MTQKMYVQQHHWASSGEGKVAWLFGMSTKLHWRPTFQQRLESHFRTVMTDPGETVPLFRLAAGRPSCGYGDNAIDCEAPTIYCATEDIDTLVILCKAVTEKSLIELILYDPKHSGLSFADYQNLSSNQNLSLQNMHALHK